MLIVADASGQGALRYFSRLANTSPDLIDEDGTPIYYINVSPEEWEKSYLEHPFFQDYNPKEKAIFRVRDEYISTTNSRNICPWCSLSMVSLQQEWINTSVTTVPCPVVDYYTDIRASHGYRWREKCSACAYASVWINPLPTQCSWIISCPEVSTLFSMVNGASIIKGDGGHKSYNITGYIIHGMNCSCTGGGLNCKWY